MFWIRWATWDIVQFELFIPSTLVLAARTTIITIEMDRKVPSKSSSWFLRIVDLMGIVLLWLHNVWVRRDAFHLLCFSNPVPLFNCIRKYSDSTETLYQGFGIFKQHRPTRLSFLSHRHFERKTLHTTIVWFPWKFMHIHVKLVGVRFGYLHGISMAALAYTAFMRYEHKSIRFCVIAD